MPRKDDKRLLWLQCLNLKLNQHAQELDIPVEALLIVLNDTNAFMYMIDFKTSMKKGIGILSLTLPYVLNDEVMGLVSYEYEISVEGYKIVVSY